MQLESYFTNSQHIHKVSLNINHKNLHSIEVELEAGSFFLNFLRFNLKNSLNVFTNN